MILKIRKMIIKSIIRVLLILISVVFAYAGQDAKSILDTTGVKSGIVVVLGCNDPELLIGLCPDSRFLVHGLDTSSKNIEKTRKELHSKNLYGPVSVTTFKGEYLPYADNLVNLIVVKKPEKVLKKEIMRVLAPYGAAIIDGEKIVKSWPKELDEWTHNAHGPDNNPVAKDEQVAIPRHLQWISDPLWARHHDETPSVSAFVSARGRIFYIIDETPTGFNSSLKETWKVVARNGFNGLLLWKKNIPVGEWGNFAWSKIKKGGYYGRYEHPILENRLVAVDNQVYVTLGYNAPVTVLNAETGKELYKYSDSPYVDEITVDNKILFISTYNKEQKPLGTNEKEISLKKVIKAYDTKTYKLLWTSNEYNGLNPKADHLANLKQLFMTVGSKHVFAVDDNEVVALDRTSGKEVWRSAMPTDKTEIFGFKFNSKGLCHMLSANEMLFVIQLADHGYRGKKGNLKQHWKLPSPSIMRAYDINKGKILWTKEVGTWGHYSMPEIYVIDNFIWVHDKKEMKILGLNMKTGAEIKVRNTADAFKNKHHHRCYQNRATEKYLITSFRGLEYLPWDSDETDHNHWVRSGCQLGMFPCNGLSYTLPHPCDCYITSKMNGVLAFAGKQNNDMRKVLDRLKTGPAYGKIRIKTDPVDYSQSWPTYRHDPERSSYIPIKMPGKLKKAWQIDLKAKELTPPVISDDMIFIAAKDRHTVYAFDKNTGSQLWYYTADGPIDSPPTIYKGLVIAGSRNGWVYCLRAADGALVWKFCAAPADQLICAFGKLESSWPVHGSILVENDYAYIVAGRSSYLNGGFYKYRVDLFTGKILEEGVVQSEKGAKVDWGRHPDVDYGLLSDILVKSDENIFMRQRSLFGPSYTGGVWGKGLVSWGGFLDDSWFSRTGLFLDGVPYGSLIVFNKDTVVSIRPYKNVGAHPLFDPAQDKYLLTADNRINPKILKNGKYKKWISNKSTFPRQKKWQKNIPLRITSMVLTEDFLYAAGTPDVIDKGPDPWKTYRAEKEGVFMCFSVDTGETIFKIGLEKAPVYDGMAGAEGNIFLSLKDGSVISFK